jgi:hypothetical protein
MSMQPRFCCAILTDSRGRHILERRPLSEADAPGMLTCFGGTRHGDEDAEACLRRSIARVLILHTPKGEAWFYAAKGPDEGTARAVEVGYEAVWMDETAMLASPELSDWHRAAYEAIARGESVARIA